MKHTTYKEVATKVVDICPDCFIDKVKPWVESQGIEFREEEIDY
jgi:hypothetical protein